MAAVGIESQDCDLVANNNWYYQLMGKELGPVQPSVLKQKANRGEIEPHTPVRRGEDGKWVEAAEVNGLFAFRAPEPALPVTSGTTEADVDDDELVPQPIETADSPREPDQRPSPPRLKPNRAKITEDYETGSGFQLLFDYTFKQYITPGLISTIYAICCLLVVVLMGFILIAPVVISFSDNELTTWSALGRILSMWAIGLPAGALAGLLWLVLTRISVEGIMVLFRISAHLADLKRLAIEANDRLAVMEPERDSWTASSNTDER